MQEAGADVEIVYPRNMTIEPCDGEVSCWWNDPGRCFIQDDMQSLYPKLVSAEAWVLGIPVYVGMPGEPEKTRRACVVWMGRGVVEGPLHSQESCPRLFVRRLTVH